MRWKSSAAWPRRVGKINETRAVRAKTIPGFTWAAIQMRKLPKKYSHYVFGVIQSGITCSIASAIASAPFASNGAFLAHWIGAYLYSWAIMLPLVVIAAPVIRKMASALTE
jgi:hypothetical protein